MVFSELYTRTLPMLRTGIVRRQHVDCDSCIFGIYLYNPLREQMFCSEIKHFAQNGRYRIENRAELKLCFKRQNVRLELYQILNYKNTLIMSHEHERESFGLHLGFKIAKLMLQAMTVAATVCIAKQLHKIHHDHKEARHFMRIEK